jgi:hypothetical protein
MKVTKKEHSSICNNVPGISENFKVLLLKTPGMLTQLKHFVLIERTVLNMMYPCTLYKRYISAGKGKSMALLCT